ncbi:MAG TPA: YaiO family outer membrane beta-barrel protein [Candidatus Sulfotelmatobacter sp.]|nr:YaiO family outer membrane beta-barrel protein [Candidatus Sulfotelmatobacter sp.]
MNPRLFLFTAALAAAVPGIPARADEPPGAVPIVAPAPSASGSPAPGSSAPPASDEPSTVLEVDASSIGFSPGSVFGPWQFLTVAGRTIAGPNDKPGFATVVRADHDSGFPTSGTWYSLDDYHTFSNGLFVYAQLQASSGTIFPRRGAYAEADPTVLPNFVFAVGGGELVSYAGLVQRYLNVGPTLYFPHGNATLRYLPLWTQGQVSASSLLGTVELGDEGRSTWTLSVQDGVEPAFEVNDPFVAATTQERTFVADLSFRHWITPRFGYVISGELGDQHDRFTGVPVYARRGATVGLFWGFGHAAAAP